VCIAFWRRGCNVFSAGGDWTQPCIPDLPSCFHLFLRLHGPQDLDRELNSHPIRWTLPEQLTPKKLFKTLVPFLKRDSSSVLHEMFWVNPDIFRIEMTCSTKPTDVSIRHHFLS